jgi:hypothetical protein
MNCREFEARLDDLLAGDLPEAARRAAAEHRDRCPACRAAEAELSALVRGAAGVPGEVEPGRDLWPAIADRIEGGRAARAAFRSHGRVRWPRVGALAAAAAVLVAATSVLTAALVSRRAPSPPTPAAAVGATASSLQLAQARGTYEAARAQLLAALGARRGSLSPATRKVVSDNLAIIDAAVREMEAALARDPGNRELPALLVTAYRQEIDVLRRATGIPARG